MKNRIGIWKRILLSLGGLFLLLIVYVLFSLFWPEPAIVLSKETTYVTEPLDDAGGIDYVAALENKYGANIPAKQNGAREYVLAFDSADTSDGYIDVRQAVLEGLELPLSNENELSFKSLEDFGELNPPLVKQTMLAQNMMLPEEAEEEWVENLFNPDSSRPDGEPSVWQLGDYWFRTAEIRPWTEDRYPLLATWLESHRQQMDHIRAGSRCKRCFFPLVRSKPDELLLSTPIYYHGVMNQVGYLFRVHATLHLGRGEHDLAWSDSQTLLIFSRHLSEQPHLIPHLTGFSLAQAALMNIADIVHYGEFTAEELAHMAREFDGIGTLEPVAEKFRGGERMLQLEIVQAQSRNEMRIACLPKNVPDLPGIDWNIVLRRTNEQFDQLEQAAELLPGHERAAIMAALDATWITPPDWGGVITRSGRSQLVANLHLCMMMSSLVTNIEFDDRHRVYHTAARTAISLTQYRAVHDEYPEKLSQLVPEFVDRIPVDRYSGEPLKYLRTEDGYKLYSVGPNGQDNGGLNVWQDEDLDLTVHDDWGITVPRPLPAPGWIDLEFVVNGCAEGGIQLFQSPENEPLNQEAAD